MAEIVSELVKILPENDWMRLAFLVFLAMLIVLRKSLFIGIMDICRYLFRWLKCRFGRHTWIIRSGHVDDNMVTGMFVYNCVICLKDDVRKGIL